MSVKSPGPVNTVSNNTSAQTEGDLERLAAAKLEAIKVDLDDRLSKQVQILFQAMGIVSLAVRAARDDGSPLDGSISQDDASNIWTALKAAHSLMSEVVGELQGCETLLAVEVDHA